VADVQAGSSAFLESSRQTEASQNRPNPMIRESVFDGRMLGLHGQVVTYPRWFYFFIYNAQRRLDRIAKKDKRPAIKIIERDKPTGFYQVLPEIKRQLADLLDIPNYRPRKSLRAFDPSYHSGRPRHCGGRGQRRLLQNAPSPLVLVRQGKCAD
jgi:hypothetical protein